MRRLIPAAFAALALAAGPVAAQDTAPHERPVVVQTTVLAPQDGDLSRQFFGRIVARQTVDLAFQVSGRLVELPLVEGALIEEGGLIAQLDTEPFQLALREAQLQAEKATRDLNRVQQLSQAAVSEATVQDRQTAASSARVSVQRAEDNLEYARLTAPFKALVANRIAANYTIVNAGQPIARVHDMSELRVEIEVPEILFRRVSGNPDEVEMWAEISGEDERFEVEFREVKAEASSVGQTYTATLALLGVTDPRIIPGASAKVIVRERRDANSELEVPDSALVFDADGAPGVVVFEQDGDDAQTGTLRHVAVQTRTNDTGSLVITDGIEAGAEIVAMGAWMTRDGQRATRFAGFDE